MPVRSFEEAEKFIKNNGSETTRAIYQWDRFYDGLIRIPELKDQEGQQALFDLHENLRKSRGDVNKLNNAWGTFIASKAVAPLKLHLNRDVFDGMIFEQVMPDVRAADPVAQAAGTSRTPSAVSKLAQAMGDAAAAPILALRKYDSMEDDPRYQAMREILHKKWYDQRENYITQQIENEGGPKRDDFADKKTSWRGKKIFDQKGYDAARQAYLKNREGGAEGLLKDSDYSKNRELDYIYGSIDTTSSEGFPTLTDHAKEAFLKSLEGRRFLKRTRERYIRSEAEKRSKSYKSADYDPLVIETVDKIADHQMARERLLYERELANPNLSEADRREFTFEKFQKDHKATITELRKRIANAEWKRFRNMYEIDPKTGKPKLDANGKPVTLAKAKLEHYQKFIKTHTESFALEPDKLPTRNRHFLFIPIPSFGQYAPDDQDPQEEPSAPAEEPQQQEEESSRQQTKPNQSKKKPKKKNRLLDKLKKKLIKQLFQKLITWIMTDVVEGIFGAIGWEGILIMLAFGAVFLILLLFHPPNLPVVAVQCGDQDALGFVYQDSSDPFGDMTKAVINPYFHLSLVGVDNTISSSDNSIHKNPPNDKHFNQAITTTGKILNAVCLLFGHIKNDNNPYDPKHYINHFGETVVGTDDERSHGKAKPVQIWIDFEQDPKLNCTLKYLNNNDIGIVIVNSDQCYSPYQIEFLVARGLTLASIDQQKHIHGGNYSTYNQFIDSNPPGPYQQDPPLPTQLCGPGSKLGVGDPLQEACFADMVGEYLIYPYYLDVPVTPPPPPKTGTSSASTLPFVKTFTDYPVGEYSDYYYFARDKIFNGQEFFTRGENVATCPDPNPDNEDQALATYGITVSGPELDDILKDDVYQTVCLLSQSPTYMKLLGSQAKGGTINIDFSANSDGYQAYTESVNLIHMWNFDSSKSPGDNPYYVRFILTHELGHVIQLKNPQLVSDFNKTFNSDYSSGSYPGTINCSRSDVVGNFDKQSAECFSDFEALFVTYSNYGGTKTGKGIVDYPTNASWTKYYQFMYTNVFGGVEFIPTGRPKGIADYALSLAQALIRTCPPPTNYSRNAGYVTNGDVSCLGGLVGFSPKPDVIQTLSNSVTDPHNGGNLQCVGFVRAVSVGIGADIGGRDAALYANPPAIAGYQWLPYNPKTAPAQFLQPGDFTVWKGSGSGQHIAVVIGVLSNGYIKFAEANGGDGSVDTKTESPAFINHSGWNLLGVQRKL